MNLLKILIFSVFFSLSCCNEDDSSNNGEKNKLNSEVKTSIENWNILKKENGASYIYDVSFKSFSGFSSVTKITVIDNKVLKRAYNSYSRFDEDGKELKNGEALREIESYEETESTIGQNSSGAKALIIDDLYETCLKDVLTVKEIENEIIFTASDNGLLKTCVYIPKGCQDDCSMGVSISNFEWIK